MARVPSVFRLGINGLQGFSRAVNEAYDGAALEFRLRRRVGPQLLGFIDCDVIPHDARAIMLSHGMGEHPVSIPILLDPRIVQAPKRDGRRRGQVRGEHGLPNYENAQMRICLRFE